jgi:hypothetical protein
MGNPVLFEAFGIACKAIPCLLVGGLTSLAVSTVAFMTLVRREGGKARRLGRAEVAAVLDADFLAGPSVGVEVSYTWNEDTLREAARRGDWLGFWLPPIAMTLFLGGLVCFFLMAAVHTGDRWLAMWMMAVPAFLLLVTWYMTFAALFKKGHGNDARRT